VVAALVQASVNVSGRKDLEALMVRLVHQEILVSKDLQVARALKDKRVTRETVAWMGL